MRFSELTTQFPESTNRLYARLGELKSGGVDHVDLIGSQVSDAGIVFPREILDEILTEASGQAQTYRPDSLGQRVARNAIAAHYENRAVSPERILLTPGTSIAYWYAFKLLCEPGENVLCPVPAYPLFDYIARLAGVEISHYRLDEDRGWKIDLEHLEDQITPQTRAIVLISPHNPTGMVADRDQIESLAGIAGRHQLPIISDEVFWNFTFGSDPVPRPLDTDVPLVFTLNGFSKMYALPGLKLGWMAVSGEDALVRKSMTTLELIADTFLPVNEIVQFSVPGIFDQGTAFLEGYKQRVLMCRNTMLEILGSVVPAPPLGGFYVVIPFDTDKCHAEEEDLAITLLEKDHVLVHPGYFYDIEGQHLVFSFFHDANILKAVLPQIRKRLGV
jgi:alanine-synthesizing transaminase